MAAAASFPTAEGLRAQIALAKRELEEKTAHTAQLDSELAQANERQSLRRELDRYKKRIALREDINLDKRVERDMIDRDMCGDHLPQGPYLLPGNNAKLGIQDDSGQMSKSDGHVMTCSKIVSKGEYTWRIEGLSWLENTLRQNGLCFCSSEPFSVAGETFNFVYNPSGGKVSLASQIHQEQRGSLAIVHEDDDGITFRYRILVKRRGGDFVQWGATGDECHPNTDTCGWAFGPDVELVDSYSAHRSAGIFGMSHKDLLTSEWVDGDALTVKFELEVRPDDWYGREPLKPHVEVPPGSLGANMKTLFEDGKCSDVTFIVEGKTIKAHAAILCVRSEVFDRQLNSGMRESMSKEILVDDCQYATFYVLLQFLYTDSFDCVEETVKAACPQSGSAGASSSGGTDEASSRLWHTEEAPDLRLALLQGLLAASHKYQVQRLQLWCEQQLCEHLTVGEVCGVLCQAHLYQAKQLEKACLTFLKAHMEEVVVTPAYGKMLQEWPEVVLKVSTFIAGVAEARAAAALDVQHQERLQSAKRKREE